MKKKIYKYVSVAVIAVAMVVSFQMSKANNATTLTLNNLITLALADIENPYGVDYSCMGEQCDGDFCSEIHDDGSMCCCEISSPGIRGSKAD